MTKFIYHNDPVVITGFKNDHIADVIAKTNTFYEVSMLTFIEKLKTPGIIIDIGANIGNHTVFFAKYTGCKKVIAIEPYKEAVKLLKNNIKRNQVEDKVQVVEAAAGKADGYCSLKIGPSTNVGLTRTIKGNNVIVRRIDDLTKNDLVSLIKIDVEGTELEVLKGAERILSAQSPFLFIEARDKPSKAKLDSYLKPLGYKSLKVFNNTPTYFYSKEPMPTK